MALQGLGVNAAVCADVLGQESGVPKSRSCFRKNWKFAVVLVLCSILAVGATLVAVWAWQRNAVPASPSSVDPSKKNTLSLQMPLGAGEDGKSHLNFGVRLDDRLQDCQNMHLKRSFPDLDYALFGYDIMKGYPLATGHDPGLTHPIFMADYSSRGQTSDCRYSLPKGLIVVPDVSCVTSFSSKVIKNKLDMSKSLEASANVEGGGWGVRFSASASYKQSAAQMSSGEFLYIISQARCHYYYSTLDLTDPPPFHPGFLSWAKRLAAPDVTQNDVIQFIKYYGTHFLSEVTFGARFVKKHKVTKTNYEELKKQDISVEAQASYSGVFSVGGGFRFASDQSKAVSKFDESVETSTSTVGAAPPSNGDAMTWAASVQDNPVPTRYTLSPIHNLFTEQFAKHLKFNFTAVRERLQDSSKLYCEALKKNGVVHSCEDSTHLDAWQTPLPGAYIESAGYRVLSDTGEKDCKLLCLQEEDCVAVQHFSPVKLDSGLDDSGPDTDFCSFYDGKKALYARRRTGVHGVAVFLPALQRLKRNLVFSDTRIQNILKPTDSVSVSTPEDCSKSCAQDADCQAFVMCDRNGQGSWCKTTKGNCYLYNEGSIDTVVEDKSSEVHFVWKNFTRVKTLF